jgi:hypothetical protein
MIIQNFNDFVAGLLEAGFSMGGGNSEGVFSLITWNWKEDPPYDTPVRWHTGDPETDPWEWRMRVLDERSDIAYAKLFFKKSGFITKEWYPYFLAVRRGNMNFEDEYLEGKIGSYEKRIYDAISEYKSLPLHEIKRLAGFGKEDNSQFERALTELQMKMYITMCGRQRKISRCGEEFGWSSTVFCTVEDFFEGDILEMGNKISENDAIEKITERIYKLNPDANMKKILKFIKG